MAITSRQVVYIVVSLIIIAVLLPIGLGLTSAMGDSLVTITNENGTSSVALDTLVDPTVLTLLTTLLPILVVVGIAMYYIPKAGG